MNIIVTDLELVHFSVVDYEAYCRMYKTLTMTTTGGEPLWRT